MVSARGYFNTTKLILSVKMFTSIRTMANVLKVETLTVNDYLKNSEYQFHNGSKFFNKKQSGIVWFKGRVGDYDPQFVNINQLAYKGNQVPD